MKRIVVLLLALQSPTSGWADTAAKDIVGSWITPLAEQTAPGGGASAFVREQIVFGAGQNIVRIEAFADPGASAPLFTYESVGTYVLGARSAAVPGALELDARNDRSTVTIHADAPELWGLLNLGSCALEVGVAVEISGCVTGPPFNAADCTELDLVSVDRQALRLGARGVDRCETRPGAMDPVVYARE